MNRYNISGVFTTGERFDFRVMANNIKAAVSLAWEHPTFRRQLGAEILSVRYMGKVAA